MKIVTPDGVQTLLEGDTRTFTFSSLPGKILRVELLDQERMICYKDDCKLDPSDDSNRKLMISLNTLVSNEFRQKVKTISLTNVCENSRDDFSLPKQS